MCGCATVDSRSGYYLSPIDSVVQSCERHQDGTIVAWLAPRPYLVRASRTNDFHEVYLRFLFEGKRYYIYWDQYSGCIDPFEFHFDSNRQYKFILRPHDPMPDSSRRDLALVELWDRKGLILRNPTTQ